MSLTQEDDPFAGSAEAEGVSHPHTPPPLPTPPDDGSNESRQEHPHRVPSTSELRSNDGATAVNDSGLSQESSIFPAEGENPLVPHHHGHRDSALEAGTTDQSEDPFGGGGGAQGEGFEGDQPQASEDPFAAAGESGIPPLNLKRVGSQSGRRLSRSGSRTGSMSQPNLHEVMYDNKKGKSSSIESRMLASRKSFSGNDDPFSQFGRRESEGSVQAPQVVTGGGQMHRSSTPQSYTSEERRAADEDPEELFLPNLQREQFIPVRVARDKIKHVLSEMAQMRNMHLGALETMEKQHAFLKAQLESATAKYVKKLTTDYNNRVTALEAEYQRRLTNLNSSAMGSLDNDLRKAKNQIKQLEERAMEKVKEREKELEMEQKMFLAKMEQQRKETQEFSDQVDEKNARISEYEQRIAELEAQVAANAAEPPKAATPPPVDEQVTELQTKLEHLQAAYDAEQQQRESLEQQAVDLQEQLIEARRGAAAASSGGDE